MRSDGAPGKLLSMAGAEFRMGRRLSEAEVTRCKRDGFLFPIEAFSREAARIGFVLFALALTALAACGCAPQNSSADEEHRGGFYGGVTGGISRP